MKRPVVDPQVFFCTKAAKALPLGELAGEVRARLRGRRAETIMNQVTQYVQHPDSQSETLYNRSLVRAERGSKEPLNKPDAFSSEQIF